MLASGGEILVAFQHVRVHEPLGGGGSSYRRSAALHPELISATKRLIAAMEYTGVAMVEFKMNLQTGAWIFVEINGRFWGSLPLAIAAGVDFPRYLYEMLVLGRKRFPQEYRVGMYGRNLTPDLRWLQGNLTADRSDPLLATRPLGKVLLEALNLLTFRESWDTLAVDDVRPGFEEIRRIGRDVTRKIFAVVRRWLISRGPIRFLMAATIRRKVRRARHVLFVCKGNICRSPFADILVRNLLPDATEVASAGYYPRDGRCCPENAVLAAQEFDVDLSQHRSRLLHRRDIDRADVVLLFDEQNRTRLLQDYPFASAKLHLLGIVLPKGSYLIEDPFSGSQAVFHETYARITEAVTSLFSQVRTEHCKYHGAC